jgi:predicted nuclease with TOPRIM domain
LRGKLSAVVIAYNRAPLIGTCVRGLGFADEVIVVDKSSTDGTAAIAARHADRVITVPWSPTVEETRAFAVAQCTHDWIVCLDDDECLSVEAIRFIQEELNAPRADVYGLLQRHYILGTHDEAAYYWPEHQIRLFRRGAVTFGPTVHGGTEVHSDSVLRVAPDTGVAIHNLSHEDVSQWIEKANRYTSRLDRDRVADHGRSLGRFAHGRIDHWLARTHDAAPGGYPEAVAVLRATYDLIDRLKTWEEERGVAGAVEFQRLCAELDAHYASLGLVRDRTGHSVAATPYSPREVDEHEVLRRRLTHFRARHDALTAERDAQAAEAARLAGDLASLDRLRDATQQALQAERMRAEQAASECTRAEAEAIAQRQRAGQAETRLNRLESEHSALRGEQDLLRGEHDRLRGKHDLLRGEHDRLRGDHELVRGEHDRLRGEHDGLERQHELLKGSLHTFLRFYLPRLRRHLFGQRP